MGMMAIGKKAESRRPKADGLKMKTEDRLLNLRL
jgi:hypothetical protein